LSRRRELLADADSVELTKPDAPIAVLLKSSKKAELPHVPSEVNADDVRKPALRLRHSAA
jgi:Zn-dependent protease with chaperone function